MKTFLDSSVLIEYIRGKKTEFLEYLISKPGIELYINPIVCSEFIFHYLSLMSGRSPLTLKNSRKIKEILKKKKPIELIKQFGLLDINMEIVEIGYRMMEKYNLLPNDGFVLATCCFYKIDSLSSKEIFRRR